AAPQRPGTVPGAARRRAPGSRGRSAPAGPASGGHGTPLPHPGATGGLQRGRTVPPSVTGAVVQALDGIRVIDMATVIAGPGAARYLADFGADVVKAETA